jgi:hypothetical protein
MNPNISVNKYMEIEVTTLFRWHSGGVVIDV